MWAAFGSPLNATEKCSKGLSKQIPLSYAGIGPRYIRFPHDRAPEKTPEKANRRSKMVFAATTTAHNNVFS
jgi:hypothetical protein